MFSYDHWSPVPIRKIPPSVCLEARKVLAQDYFKLSFLGDAFQKELRFWTLGPFEPADACL